MTIKSISFYDDKYEHIKNGEYIFETDLDKLNRFIHESNLDKSDVINVSRNYDAGHLDAGHLTLYYWSKEGE